MPGTLSRKNASWKARHVGSVTPGSLRASKAALTARLATRKASKACASLFSASMPRSMRVAATPASRSSSSAASLRFADRRPSFSLSKPIQSRYEVTSGESASAAASPSSNAPSAAMESVAPGTSTVAVFSTCAAGIHVVRTLPHWPSCTSQSAETPCPVANSGVSA